MEAVNGQGMAERPRLRLVSAAELALREFPEPKWAVDGIIPEGLSILAGDPKIGKSWLALNVGIAVASGGVALGSIEVEQGDVLYLALEDTERRLADRLRKLCPDGSPPRLAISTTCPAFDRGGLAEIDGWLLAAERPRLVIVDTLAKVRPARKSNGDKYAEDYAAIAPAKAIADKYGIALVIVHHLRKMAAEDPLARISGTQGLSGSSDTILVLSRCRFRFDATLFCMGRDVEEQELGMQWHADTCQWTVMGDTETAGRTPEKQAIIDVLANAAGPLKPAEIASILGRKDGTIRQSLRRMAKAGEVRAIGNGRYSPLTVSLCNSVTQ